MKQNTNPMTQRLVKMAVVAALYAVLTIALPFLSYGTIQCRISEVMVLLAFVDPLYIGGLTLGCLIANLLGPNGPMDIIFGTLATFMSVSAISLTAKLTKGKNYGLFIASLWPTIFNAVILAFVFYKIADAPFWLTMFEIGIGEFVAVTILGIPVFFLLMKRFMRSLAPS